MEAGALVVQVDSLPRVVLDDNEDEMPPLVDLDHEFIHRVSVSVHRHHFFFVPLNERRRLPSEL